MPSRPGRAVPPPGAGGVTVEEQAEVEAAAGDEPQRLVDVGPYRLRVDAAEIRVALAVDLRDADSPAGQQACHPAGARPVHGVHEDVDVRRAQGVEVDGAAHEALVAGAGKGGRGGPGRQLRALVASIPARTSVPAAEPVGALTLKPLSVQGLWLAV